MSSDSAKTILVIEDNKEMLAYTRTYLKRAGFEVLVSVTGAKGVELTRSALPHLVLCDVTIPDMDGFKILEQHRAHAKTAGIPFIFLTSDDDIASQQRARELGADDYLIKPISITNLIHAIQVQLVRYEHVAATESALNSAQRQLTAMVAHELRTPLISITMARDLLARHLGEGDPQANELLDMLGNGTRRLTHLIEQIVLITQLESGNLSREIVRTMGIQLDMWSILTAAADLTKRYNYHEKVVEFQMVQHDGDAQILCHPASLKQAMAELITNAIAFSHEGGTVRIKQIVIDNFIHVVIDDYGIGIPKEKIQDIMQPFYQHNRAEQEQQGMGLGIPLANRVIEAHGGNLGIASEVGQGTRVTVILPLAEQAQGE